PSGVLLGVVPGTAQSVPGARTVLVAVRPGPGAGPTGRTGGRDRQGRRLRLAARPGGTEAARVRPDVAALPGQLLRDAAADRRPAGPAVRRDRAGARREHHDHLRQ